MNDYSLIEKIKILMNLVISSPLFLSCFFIALILLVVYIICLKKEKQINKWIFVVIWIVLFLIIFAKYSNIIFEVMDGLFNEFFMALYFPNLFVYSAILVIINVSFIYSIIKKRIKKSYKLVNFIFSLILDIFSIFIIEIVNANSIDIAEQITVFSNSSLLILLELSTALFVSWLLILLLISAKYKLKKYDMKAIKKPEIVFEDL